MGIGVHVNGPVIELSVTLSVTLFAQFFVTLPLSDPLWIP